MSIIPSANSARGAGGKTQIIVWTGALVLTVAMIIISCLMAFSGSADKVPQVGVGLTAFLVYTGAIAVGAFLGFLFGLPRARVVDQVNSEQAGASKAATHFLANSNLIKVSDWLTTIIIGLTLVNLGAIVPAARDLSDALSGPLGGYPYSAAVGLAVAIGSVIAGFLLGFLWTSIRVRELMEEAERRAVQTYWIDLVGLTVKQAKQIAANQGFTVVVPVGAVDTATITDQDPKPGTGIGPNDEIKVTV